MLFFCFYQYSSIFTAWKKHEQSIQEELMTFSIIAVQYLENKAEIEGLLQLYNSIAGIDFKKEIVLLLEDSRKDSLQFAIECFRQRIQKKQCIAVFELLGKEMPEEESFFPYRCMGRAFFFWPILCFYLQNALTYTKINIKVAESGSKWFKVGDISPGGGFGGSFSILLLFQGGDCHVYG